MAELQTQTVSNGETVFIVIDESEHGLKGPFYVVYSAEGAENRWDYLRGNCGSLDTVMDTMARIECNNCGNVRKSEERDAAHE